MGENTVNLDTIIEEFNRSVEGATLEHAIPSLKIGHYVPIAIKITAIEEIIKALGKESESYPITVNSISAYHALITTTLQLYTNIEFEGKSAYEVLDSLAEAGLIDRILEEIGKDFEEFKKLYKLAWEDHMRNHNSLEAIVSRELRFINLSIQEAIVEGAKEIDSTEVMKTMIEKLKVE